MAIQPTQPQPIGGVLDTSLQLYKASIGSVWPICLLLVLGSSPPSIYLIMQGGLTPNPSDPMAALAIFGNPTYWLTYLLSLVLTMWALGALYLKVQACGSGEDLAVATALQGSLGRIVTLVLMSILFSIALVVGMVLLIVPGLILMVSLILAWNLVVFEGKGPVDALTGSHRLVWGNWWRTATILTIGFIIVCIIYFAVALVIGLVMPLVGLGAQDPFMFGLVTGLVIGAVVNLLVTPYFIALLISVYWDLKLRKEGGDLAARVGALGTA